LNMGVREGIRQIGTNWTEAGGKAHLSLNLMKAGVSGLTVAVKALGAVINWAFKIFMAITIAWSTIKGIVSLWHDFDKPFKKAAESAKVMREQLHGTLEKLNEKPEFINFEGIAGNFNHALKNSSFAANLADEVYNSSHKAMLKISDEMAKMGWLDKLIDKIKGLIGMTTFRDQLADSLIYQMQITKQSGQKLPSELQAIMDMKYEGGGGWEDFIKVNVGQSELVSYRSSH